jgi:protein-tyrosine phosphatase
MQDPTRIDLGHDPREMRFRGVAYHGNTPFDVPYISHITDNLWVGGCEWGLVLPEDIKHVVSLYPWEKYTVEHELDSFREITMYDSLDQATEQVREIADHVNECRKTGQTLVHCQAGLNRSNLVAGAALIQGGMAPADAIALLRERRSPAVLCNHAFEEALLAWDA